MTEDSFGDILSRLTERKIDFVLIGGLAGMAHGAARATFDVDVVYSRTDDNVSRLAEALSDVSPYLRGAPPGRRSFLIKRRFAAA